MFLVAGTASAKALRPGYWWNEPEEQQGGQCDRSRVREENSARRGGRRGTESQAMWGCRTRVFGVLELPRML